MPSLMYNVMPMTKRASRVPTVDFADATRAPALADRGAMLSRKVGCRVGI